ncbi:hypothetical protein MGH68_04665 [Erysipelothrix sp. D19-032]
MLGGGVIGITKTTNHEAAGIKFLEWLYSPEISALITYLGGSILTNKVHENVDVLRIYPWIEKYPEYFAKGKRREESPSDIGIDEFDYEMILGEAIRSYMLRGLDTRRCIRTSNQNIKQEKVKPSLLYWNVQITQLSKNRYLTEY